MRPIIRMVTIASFVMALALAPSAAADTLLPRSSAFTPSQAPADQYTTPPGGAAPTTSVNVPGAVAGETSRGQEDEGGVAGDSGGGPAGGQGVAPTGAGPALVEGATAAPDGAKGTLPFTGGDLLALVWLALALVALGSLVELARRRIEAARASAGT